MKAKGKPIARETLQGLGLADLRSNLRITSVTEPPVRAGGVILDSVDDLLAKLKEKGVIS